MTMDKKNRLFEFLTEKKKTDFLRLQLKLDEKELITNLNTYIRMYMPLWQPHKQKPVVFFSFFPNLRVFKPFGQTNSLKLCKVLT